MNKNAINKNFKITIKIMNLIHKILINHINITKDIINIHNKINITYINNTYLNTIIIINKIMNNMI